MEGGTSAVFVKAGALSLAGMGFGGGQALQVLHVADKHCEALKALDLPCTSASRFTSGADKDKIVLPKCARTFSAVIAKADALSLAGMGSATSRPCRSRA